MRISRRRFLQGATAGALSVPTLFSNPFVGRALANIGNRYLVVLFLDGGNDGLNTIAPIDNGGATLRDAYDGHRGTGGGGLNLTPAQLLSIGNDPGSGASLGLHPGLHSLHDLHVDKGAVAFIQGCGYPEYSLSHEVSSSIWQTGNPLGNPAIAGTGWLGRHLAATYGASAIPGVTIDNSFAGVLRQSATSVLAIERLEDFGFPYDDFYAAGGDIAAKRAAFDDLYQAAGANAQSQLSFIGTSGVATLLSSEAYPPLHALYETERAAQNQAYDSVGRNTAEDLREVAKIIYGVEQGVTGVEARFFHLSNGGYDTHSDQGAGQTTGRHYELHAEVADSLKVFYEDLEDMGAADRVCVLVWSEFSRRLTQNSNGTDHGSHGPMFLIGGQVNGGVFGSHPNINDAALDGEGNSVYSQAALDPFRSTDFRDVYGTVLKHWCGMTQMQVQAMLPADAGNPNEYWTAPNFDLSLFLP